MKNFMKILNLRLALIAACAAFAFSPGVHAGPADEAQLAEAKKQMITHIESRIAALNEAKTCISAAADKEAIQSCHQKLRAAHDSMAEKRIQDRKARRQKDEKK